jgi:hypothetical protein
MLRFYQLLLNVRGAHKQQMKSESGFPFSRICPVHLIICLLSQFLTIRIKFVCSGKLALKSQICVKFNLFQIENNLFVVFISIYRYCPVLRQCS